MPQGGWAREPQLLNLCSGALELHLPRPRAAATEARAPWAQALQREKPLR